MISLFIVFVLSLIATEWIIGSVTGIKEKRTIRKLYWWHLFFCLVYYSYASINRSDSKRYYLNSINQYYGESWSDYYGISTKFIEWLTFPLVDSLGFSYEACMLLFGFLGFVGWVYVYLMLSERTKFQHRIRILGQPMDLLTLIVFLPNNHFWSGSLGKGSAIIFGIGLLLYGMSRPQKRIGFLILGALFAYHVRPHILYVIMAGAVMGVVYSSKGISQIYRWLLVLVGGAVMVYLLNDILSFTALDAYLEGDTSEIEHRAAENAKAGSGLDLQNMNLPLKVFTFLFRPLFFDAHNALALYTSLENALYLYLFLQLFRKDIVKFLLKSDYMVISSVITFFAVSIVLAQVSGNLGLAVRQKSQVFFLILFVLLQYKDWKATQQYKRWQRRQAMQMQLST